MKVLWQRYEGPTWVVALAIYGGWLAVATLHRQMTPWIAVPLAVYLTAWHSSLQHETIHAMRRVPRWLRTLLAFPPLGIWFPYELYRREHLRHHCVADLTGPQDPESFYFEPDSWSAMPGGLRALYIANQTLAGRLTIGPALLVGRAYAREFRRLRAGDRRNVLVWSRHLAVTAFLLWLIQIRCGVPPLLYLTLVAYPATSLGLIRSFAEHRAAANPRDRTATVVSRGALSLLFLNNNFHATHHIKPTLPWYEIPAYWRADAMNAHVSGATYVRGYRQIVLSWLWRPLDLPIRNFSRATEDFSINHSLPARAPFPARHQRAERQ